MVFISTYRDALMGSACLSERAFLPSLYYHSRDIHRNTPLYTPVSASLKGHLQDTLTETLTGHLQSSNGQANRPHLQRHTQRHLQRHLHGRLYYHSRDTYGRTLNRLFLSRPLKTLRSQAQCLCGFRNKMHFYAKKSSQWVGWCASSKPSKGTTPTN